MNRCIELRELCAGDITSLHALATLSCKAAQLHNPGWLVSDAQALQVLLRCVVPGNLSHMALLNGVAAGWISAFPVNPHRWEIHPLLVDPACQRHGLGTLLVRQIERLLKERGVRIIQVSTTDATKATTLSSKDLFHDPIGELQRLDVNDPAIGHAYQFWLRTGYQVVGVVPDAGGIGVPDICLAKRIQPT